MKAPTWFWWVNSVAAAFFVGGMLTIWLLRPSRIVVPKIDNSLAEVCVAVLERSTGRLRQAVDMLEQGNAALQTCTEQRDEALQLARDAADVGTDLAAIGKVYMAAVVNCSVKGVADVRQCLVDQVQRGMVGCGAACATPTPLVPPESVVGPQLSGGTPWADAVAWCRSVGADYNAENLANCVGMQLGLDRPDQPGKPYNDAVRICMAMWPGAHAGGAYSDEVAACITRRLGIPQ